jgi:hypothetical protein
MPGVTLALSRPQRSSPERDHLGFWERNHPQEKDAVSAKRRRLERAIREVVEASEELREKLRHYEHTAQTIARQLEKGDGVIAAARGPFRVDRRQVTEGIEEFESARHELRLALMAAGREEGASMSDVGRVLGISRQLASRLAAEVEEADS